MLINKAKNCMSSMSRGELKCDGTRAETRFRLLTKRTSPFKSAGASVQSTTGSRGVRISGSNAGYTMFRCSVKSTGYPLHSPISPFTSPTVRHRVPSRSSWTLPSFIFKYMDKWGVTSALKYRNIKVYQLYSNRGIREIYQLQRNGAKMWIEHGRHFLQLLQRK